MILRTRSVTSVLGAMALTLLTGKAAAVPTLSTRVLSIYQVGNGAGVSMGHVVSAGTNFNRLIAGGTYSAHCASSDMPPVSGQRTLSIDNYWGGLSLLVTIPEWTPTVVNMPGFYSLTRGTTVACSYDWTSRAVEGGYSISLGVLSYLIGNDERSEGSSQPFQMSVPGDTNTDDWQSCIP